jgi:hypothetical protein
MKRLVLVLLGLAMASGCTSDADQPTKPEPPEALTGRSAFQQMYVAAHGWAPDVRPYQLQSQVTGNYKGTEGKAVIWSAAFASASLRSSKPYTWSGIDSPDAPSRGISPGTQDSFTPNNTFDIQFLKVDSDQALGVAQKNGGDKTLQENPGIPVLYLLDWNRSNNNLIWHVIYGNSRNDAKLTVDVDATSGVFLRTEK